MAGLNDELDEELRLAAEQALTDGVDIKDYLPPAELEQQPAPADNLFLLDSSMTTDEEPTAEQVLGDNLVSGQLPMKEVEFAFLDETENVITALEEIKANIEDVGGVSQNDIAVLSSAYTGYLTENDNIGYYTKAPTKTLYNQTVAKVDKLIAEHHNIKKEFVDKAIKDTELNIVQLSQLVYTLYEKTNSDRVIELRKYSDRLKQKDYDKYVNLNETLTTLYAKYLALVILLNTLTDGFELDVAQLFNLTDPTYVAAHLQEPKYTTCSLVNFIGSDYEKRFFNVTMTSALSFFKDQMDEASNEKTPTDVTIATVKKVQQQVMSLNSTLLAMQMVYTTVVHITNTAGDNKK